MGQVTLSYFQRHRRKSPCTLSRLVFPCHLLPSDAFHLKWLYWTVVFKLCIKGIITQNVSLPRTCWILLWQKSMRRWCEKEETQLLWPSHMSLILCDGWENSVIFTFQSFSNLGIRELQMLRLVLNSLWFDLFILSCPTELSELFLNMYTFLAAPAVLGEEFHNWYNTSCENMATFINLEPVWLLIRCFLVVLLVFFFSMVFLRIYLLFR